MDISNFQGKIHLKIEITSSSRDWSIPKKSLFFRDTGDNQKYRLSIPGPSPERPVAEIARLKNATFIRTEHIL